MKLNIQKNQSVIFLPAQPPTIQTPATIVSGQESELICIATSQSEGQVIWMGKKSGETDFSPAFADVALDEVTKQDSCGSTHRITVRQVLDDSWNGAYVRCDVSIPASTSEEVQLVFSGEEGG